MTWHRDKLNTFAGTTILLSHHQLFSATERLSKGARPYLNENLHATFQPYFDRIAAWFWGHEHNLIIFKDNLVVPGRRQTAAQRTPCRRCSAYEESQAQDPFRIDEACKAASFMDHMPRLKLSKYRSHMQAFYDHAFALLEVSPQQIKVSYYDYPSWDQKFAPPDPPIGPPLFTEVLSPIHHPVAPPA